MNEIIDYKVLLFLINFFDGIGFAVRYPLDIFFGGNYNKDYVDELWKNNNRTDSLQQLYVHTLFCDTKCHYCNCMGYVEKKKSKKIIYKNQIITELKHYGKIITKNLNTLYFGGGTFTLWTEEEIEEILTELKNNFSFTKNYIWTIEVHPDTINFKKLKLLKFFGVTNIMVGIQTISDRLNKLNNRPFDRKKLDSLINNLIKLRFKKLSFDIVYNIPFQKIEELEDDLKYLVEIGEKLKTYNIKANIEINKWDISHSIPFFKDIILKNNLNNYIEKFLKNNQKMVSLVDYYIDKYYLELFETGREEIEARKKENTSILGLGHGSVSYIPEKLIYRTNIDINNLKNWNNIDKNNFIGYKLNKNDNKIFIFLHNLRRGVDKNIFKEVISSNLKIYNYMKEQKNKFKLLDNKIIFDTNSDLDIDLMTLLFFKEKDLKEKYNLLLNKWYNLGYSKNYLYENIDNLLKIYYQRNKLY